MLYSQKVRRVKITQPLSISATANLHTDQLCSTPRFLHPYSVVGWSQGLGKATEDGEKSKLGWCRMMFPLIGARFNFSQLPAF